MENSMVDFDNNFLPSSKAIPLVKSFFEISFNGFVIESEYDKCIYWQVVFVKENIKIMIGSGRGILDYFIEKDNKKIDITTYESRLKHTLIASSEKNINFVLSIIKSVMSEVL